MNLSVYGGANGDRLRVVFWDADGKPKRYSDLPPDELKEYHRIKSRWWYENHRRNNPERLTRIADRRRTLFRQRKIQLVELLGGRCEECGFDKHPAALDFHHRDPSLKEFTIGSNRLGKWDRLVAEAKKCILLCSNCHRIHHWGNRS